ncbi:MAG: tetratricopeptide repeat protein [candidate division Zixibacteria bacterium]|nr:tetratricopeptide repeat protein [candidate division Zixibacteria bacterium]
MIDRRKVSIILLCLLTISGCSSEVVRRDLVELRSPHKNTVADTTIQLTPLSEKIDEKAFYLYSNAVVYEAAGFLYQAAENYRKALAHYRDSYEIRTSLALTLYRMQHFDDALTALVPVEPEDNQVWMLRGQIFRAAGETDSAHFCYQRAVAADSNDAMAYSYLVAVYQVLGQADSAVWAYEHLARLKPNNARIWYDLGELQWDLKHLTEAGRSFQRSVAINADSSNLLAVVRLGDLYTVQRHSDSAIEWYLHALDLAPEDYRLWRKLGGTYNLLGNPEYAKTSYLRSLELRNDATNIMTRVWLGETYLGSDSVEQGLKIATEGLSLSPENPMLHRLISSQYLQMEQLDSALVYAVSEIALTPTDIDANRRLAILYFYNDSMSIADSILNSLVEQGDRNPINHRFLGRIALRNENYLQAAIAFGKLTEIAETEVDSWLDLAFAYRQQKQHDNEIETYRSGLEHITDDDGKLRLMFGLAVAYEQSGLFDSAVVTFEDLLQRDPDNHQVLNYLGYSLADRGLRLNYARDLIVRAVQMEPDNAAYLDSYGWVSYRLGEYDKALDYLKRAVVLDSDPTIFDHLGDTYKATGDSIAARQWWNKALNLDPDNEAIKTKLIE